ncbi:MAG: hypothetical protein C5S44_00570 [Candidatus Methanocomedens sp.]|nr:MAG: hypothetical protein C5S44_00570 [ANME-2 cluster archaeon]
MNDTNLLKEKKWRYLIFLTISILFSIFVSIPANAAVGDLILDSEILLRYHDPHWGTTLSTTMLKEGYSLSLYDVYSDHTVAEFTIYKNEEIVKRIKVNEGDYFYYNKTIDGREYTIIESKVDKIFLGTPNNLVKLEPFYQYSDGSTIIEPEFVSTILNPKTTDAPSEEWNRTFGGIYNDNGWSVQQTSDDGYILGGTIESLNPNGGRKYSDDAWLIKVDVNGNEQWNKTFRDLYIRSVLHLHDDGYIFVGIKPTERSPTVLVKTDVNGNQQWSKSFFDLGDAQSIQQTSDGGFILAGKSYGAKGTDARLVKTDSNGSEQWSKTFGLDGVYTTSSVRETPDGGYILTGHIWWDENPGPREVWLLKADSNGTEQWNMTFGGAGQDRVNSFQNTLDGGYILAGRTGGDAWLLKTDANGNEQWDKTFGLDGFDRVYSVVQTSDGGYVLAGEIDTAKNPDFKGQILYSDSDAWLFKTDANGTLEWSKTIGGLKSDEARSVQLTSDGGYVIAGTTESYGSGSSDIWLVKVSGTKVDTTQSGARLSDDNFTENLQSGIPAEPDGGDAPTDGEPVQTPDIPGFNATVAVMGLLVWVCLAGRRL